VIDHGLLMDMALQSVGSTTHYNVSYDTTLSAADGQQRAQSLLSLSESDHGVMSDWFGGIALPYSLPVAVNIVPGGYARAGWGPPISLQPGNGSGMDVVRYLLVAEVVEMFMLAQNAGWFASDGSNEGSAGEGLSRFLSAEFLRRTGLGFNEPGFDTSGLWINSDRLDYVNAIDEHDHAPDAKSGCATLFIYYLSYQLGYQIKQIVQAAAPSLAGVYRNLTGRSDDPFPAFKALVDAHFPRTNPDGSDHSWTIPGPNPDNPFPLDFYQGATPMAVRIFWRMNPGRNVVNLNWNALSADSVVAVSASEYVTGGQKLADNSAQRFVGSASITVDNITPHGPPFDPNHGVTFVVTVGWSSALNICTDVVLIENQPQSVLYIGSQTQSGTQTPDGGSGPPSPSLDQPVSMGSGPITFHTATVTSDGSITQVSAERADTPREVRTEFAAALP